MATQPLNSRPRAPWHNERREFNRRGSTAFAAFTALPRQHPDRKAARRQLIESHVPLAARLARRYRRYPTEGEDLRQVATVGLIKAVDRFDPRRGEPFATYAVPTIVGELRRHFRDNGWALRVPRRLQELHPRLSQVAATATQRLGRPPTDAELATELGVDEPSVVKALACAAARHAWSLDAPAQRDGDRTVAATVGTEDPELDRVELRVAIRQMLSRLPEPEARIMRMRLFGEHSQDAIAARLGMSQTHVSRLQARALGRLRRLLSA